MPSSTNPFGPSGALHVVDIHVDMESIYDRHGKGIKYRAQLSFDPAIFEPGSGKKLGAGAFFIKTMGFDEEDLDHLDAIGVSASRWEGSALKSLAGFGAIDIWLEESATDAQTQWLEDSGYLDDVVDMEGDCDERFSFDSFKPLHA